MNQQQQHNNYNNMINNNNIARIPEHTYTQTHTTQYESSTHTHTDKQIHVCSRQCKQQMSIEI